MCEDPRCADWGRFFPELYGHGHSYSRPKLAEFTGMVDADGQDIYEGDVLEYELNEHYGNVRVVVKWDPEYGAWVSKGEFSHGGGHQSLNAGGFKGCRRIGSLDQNPEFYYPAKKLREI